MTKWQDFLLEHAKFLFPDTVDSGSANSADVSSLEIGDITKPWKAKYAIRDETLVANLCLTLEKILGDTPIEVPDDTLRSLFGRHLGFLPSRSGAGEHRVLTWTRNRNEIESRALLDDGVLKAAAYCSQEISAEEAYFEPEHAVTRGHSKVDYLGSLGEKPVVLVEAKSPTVMMRMGELLPTHGISLKWVTEEPLVPRVFQKVALYLGLRKMEWLFLTCHNHWIICRLVSDPDNPFLAYSPSISIEGSSEPFRALLGAMLSVYNNVSVPASVLSADMGHDDILEEDQGDGFVTEDDADDGSGSYADLNSSTSTITITSKVQLTRSKKAGGGQAPGVELMITSSSPHSPESFQVWVRLQPLPNNNFFLPLFAEDGDMKERLWLTRVIGSGSTGTVWQCYSDKSGVLYAIKVVELLCRSDVERLQRFWNEVEVYLTLEMAYQSGQLCNRITPHCYGAFKGDRTNVLVLELCDGTLDSWDELDISEKTRVYGLILDLHSVGIIHGDLEPRNIARVPGHEFLLIDFSSSARHTCVEFAGELDKRVSKQATRYKCSELQAMRKVLKLRLPHPEAGQNVALETKLNSAQLSNGHLVVCGLTAEGLEDVNREEWRVRRGSSRAASK